MPFVVVDTSISLPATLSPRGLMRRFWVVLALGALTYEVEHRRLELDELSRQTEREGGVVGGLKEAHARIGAARSRRTGLLELLPEGTPDDWVAIGSASLFDEYERKLREIGPKLDPALRDEDIPALRRQLEAVCIAGAPPFDPDTVPELTQDRKDDAILFTALVGDADLLISDDKHLVPDRHEHPWEYGGRVVTAITFDTLVNERLDRPAWVPSTARGWRSRTGRTLRIRRRPGTAQFELKGTRLGFVVSGVRIQPALCGIFGLLEPKAEHNRRSKTRQETCV